MDPRHLELAAEFGRLTGQRDLIEYLGLTSGATPDEAKAALRARRKKMQGMQANPKYRREAVFLIKNNAALEAVLSDLDAYRSATVSSHESTQVPILEMAIQGALAGGGPLSAEQRGHVQEMSRRLGISDSTFEQTLSRLTAAHSTPAVSPKPPTLPRPPSEPPPAPPLSGSEVLYGPSLSPMAAPTAPPMRSRTHDPKRPPPVPSFATNTQTLSLDPDLHQLEIIGDPIRHVQLGDAPVVHEIRVRSLGRSRTAGRVSADASWISVSPQQLDPNRDEQTISVYADPSQVTGVPQSAVVHIVTDSGARASIVFEAIAAPPAKPPVYLYVAIGVAISLIIGAALYLISVQAGP